MGWCKTQEKGEACETPCEANGEDSSSQTTVSEVWAKRKTSAAAGDKDFVSFMWHASTMHLKIGQKNAFSSQTQNTDWKTCDGGLVLPALLLYSTYS